MRIIFLPSFMLLISLNALGSSFSVHEKTARKIYKKFNVEEKINANLCVVKESEAQLHCVKSSYLQDKNAYRCLLGDGSLKITQNPAKALFSNMSTEVFREIGYSWKAAYGTLSCEVCTPPEGATYECRFNHR